MTNEEAISYLESMPKYINYNNEDYYAVSWEILEAIELAKEALENNDKLAEDLQKCLEIYKKKKAEVEALRQNQWIPCSERLPEDCQRVLIQVINGNMYVINFSAVGATSHIVAWMPLPEPYKEEPDD